MIGGTAMLENFRFARFNFSFETRGHLRLPDVNRVNPLRGAFGLHLRRRSCRLSPPCHDRCRLREECLYGRIFEPAPPPDATRLSANSDIPRPFVIRAPLDGQTEFPPGSDLTFDLTLFGFAIAWLPAFAQVFADVARQGLGPSRTPLKLADIGRRQADQSESLLVQQGDRRVLTDPGPGQTLADLLREAPDPPTRLWMHFLTPMELKHEGRLLESPDFHHIFKRLRDRVSALSYFHCGEVLQIDHRELGRRSEQIRTLERQTVWLAQDRRSSRSGQRHPMGGFTGRALFEGDFRPFWPFLQLGRQTHIGRHAVWGNGQYELSEG